jgi:hypothetical protein
MQQATRRGQHQLSSAARGGDTLQRAERCAQVGTPDIASIHDTQRKPAVTRNGRYGSIKFPSTPHQFNMQPGYRQAGGRPRHEQEFWSRLRGKRPVRSAGDKRNRFAADYWLTTRFVQKRTLIKEARRI